ncbi:hypothetical protein AAMO2058_000837300 [Amorphochlora amoebiformis]
MVKLADLSTAVLLLMAAGIRVSGTKERGGNTRQTSAHNIPRFREASDDPPPSNYAIHPRSPYADDADVDVDVGGNMESKDYDESRDYDESQATAGEQLDTFTDPRDTPRFSAQSREALEPPTDLDSPDIHVRAYQTQTDDVADDVADYVAEGVADDFSTDHVDYNSAENEGYEGKEGGHYQEKESPSSVNYNPIPNHRRESHERVHESKTPKSHRLRSRHHRTSRHRHVSTGHVSASRVSSGEKRHEKDGRAVEKSRESKQIQERKVEVGDSSFVEEKSSGRKVEEATGQAKSLPHGYGLPMPNVPPPGLSSIPGAMDAIGGNSYPLTSQRSSTYSVISQHPPIVRGVSQMTSQLYGGGAAGMPPAPSGPGLERFMKVQDGNTVTQSRRANPYQFGGPTGPSYSSSIPHHTPVRYAPPQALTSPEFRGAMGSEMPRFTTYGNREFQHQGIDTTLQAQTGQNIAQIPQASVSQSGIPIPFYPPNYPPPPAPNQALEPIGREYATYPNPNPKFYGPNRAGEHGYGYYGGTARQIGYTDRHQYPFSYTAGSFLEMEMEKEGGGYFLEVEYKDDKNHTDTDVPCCCMLGLDCTTAKAQKVECRCDCQCDSQKTTSKTTPSTRLATNSTLVPKSRQSSSNPGDSEWPPRPRLPKSPDSSEIATQTDSAQTT